MTNTPRSRADALGLSQAIWATLASNPASRIHQADVARWLRGVTLTAGKSERLLATLAEVEALVAADPFVRIDLSSVDNIRAGLARLADNSRHCAGLSCSRLRVWADFGTGAALTGAPSTEQHSKKKGII
jgi:hypothetical protein